jgi:hypothetical protein
MVEQQKDEGFTEDFASVYRRELPGGGYVAIHVRRQCADSPSPRTRVAVERRLAGASPRPARDPIVIAEADGDEHSPGFTELYRIAADNAAIARALLRLGAVGLHERAD